MSGDGAPEVDQDLYSRQLGVFGMETMGKLIQMKVLIVGMTGVGVETAKNLILAGPHSVAIHDPVAATAADMGVNFFISPEDLGKSRAEACLPQLAELNSYVKVSVLPELTEAAVGEFHAVVFTSGSQAEHIRWNEFCRAQSPAIAFMASDVMGVAGYAFSDFGPAHVMRDADGEQVKTAIVADIEHGKDGVSTVFTHDTKRHGLSDGDHVVFSEVDGMPSLNDGTPREISNVGQYSFDIKGVTGAGTYGGGGVVEQVKVPSTRAFGSLSERLTTPLPDGEPMMNTPDLGKWGRPEQLHMAFRALRAYEEKHGSLPAARNAAAAEEVVGLASELNDAAKAAGSWCVEELDTKVVSALALTAAAQFAPLCAFFGGIVAQEVVKVTGKYTPINQWLYLDACEVLPNDAEGAGAGEEFTPTGDRYTHLHTLLGATFTAKLRDQRVFLVGAGALGCEFLKNFALLGVSTGAGGHVMVTDMDRIEVSNLNRQFLFRSDNVGKPKSVTAAAAAVRMNGDMKIDATEVPVGHDTENTFDDAFWEGRDVVVNALDNVKARLYVDGKCVWHGLPLLESGTLGTKANTQVVAPHKTESYGDSVDPPEESIPMCTLKNFPYKIEHCIQWARDLFEGSFAASVQEAASFAADPAKWLANLASEGNMHARRLKLEAVQAALAAADGATFEGCVAHARRLFHTSFHTNIRQLLHNFPADYVDSKGNKFWSGTKRTPTAADFNSTDEGHLAFIAAATHLVAANYGVSLPEGWSTPDVLGPLLERVTVEPFVPRSVRIKADDGDTTNEGADDDEVVVERLIGELRAVADKEDLSKVALAPAEFEKDDDTNFHVDFITAAANLRARNYDLKTASRHQCKMIAGKIIPAIATTTCAVTGLVCLELIKIIKGEPLESYRNTFMNLAINLFSMAEPGEPKRVTSKDFDPMVGGPVKAKPEGFSNWDKLVIKEGALTCNQLVAYVERTQGVEVSMISAGALMLFAPLMYASHRARGDQDVKAVWEAASKSEVGGGRKYIVLDIACEDDDGDVVIPTVQYFFE